MDSYACKCCYAIRLDQLCDFHQSRTKVWTMLMVDSWRETGKISATAKIPKAGDPSHAAEWDEKA